MQYTQHAQQPIGYWLKRLDTLIDAAFERALAADGLQRRHWQTLQVLERRPHSELEVHAALAPFFAADGTDPRQVLHDLTNRGWAVLDESAAYALTANGREASARLADRIGAVRRQTTAGVSQEQYRATVMVLERMADNLAAA